MRSTILKNQNGFTLLEVVLYIAIVGLLLTTVGLLVNATNQAKAREAIRQEVEEQGSHVLEVITSTVRNASALTTPAISSTGAVLSVDVDTSSASPTAFTLVDGALFITEGSGTPVALTNTHVVATDFVVQNLSYAWTPGTIRVNFTLSSLTVSVSIAFVYTQTFYGTASLR